jgi:hypothetical protein
MSATDLGGAKRFHKQHKARGWDGLGYHFVIGNGSDTADGEIEVGHRWKIQNCIPDSDPGGFSVTVRTERSEWFSGINSVLFQCLLILMPPRERFQIPLALCQWFSMGSPVGHDRILLTHDDDHLPDAPGPRVFFVPNQRLPVETTVRAIESIGRSVASVEDLPAVVYVTEEWV